MGKKLEPLIKPVQIPVEPHIYALLSKGFCNDKLKKCMFKAVNKYNVKCEKAYMQLINELKECLKEKSS